MAKDKEEIDGKALAKAFSLLTDGNTLIKLLPLIDPEGPQQPELRWTLSVVKTYFDRYGTAPDFEVLRSILQKDKKLKEEQKEILEPFINRMEKAKPKRSTYEYYTDMFEQFMRECYFRNMVSEIAELANNGDTAQAEEILAASKPPRRVELAVKYAPKDIKMLFQAKDDEMGIPTGIKSLDDIMGGGLRPGELGIALAPTGYGKSMFLVHLGAKAWTQGMNVVHFSFENSEEETMRRYLCNLTGQPFDTLKGAGGMKSPYIDKLRLQESSCGSQIAVVRLQGSVTTAPILLANLHNILDYHEFDPNLLIVDYGDLMRPSHRADNKYEEMQVVFGELHDLAVEAGIPLWTATQSNRQGLTAKRVKLDHISESLGKAMVADIIVSLSRPNKGDEVEVEDDDNKEEGILKVLKFRRGEEGHRPIYVRTNFAIARFEEVEPPPDEASVDARGESVRNKRKQQREEDED